MLALKLKGIHNVCMTGYLKHVKKTPSKFMRVIKNPVHGLSSDVKRTKKKRVKRLH